MTAPSSGVDGPASKRIDFCVEWLRKAGYEVVVGECMDGSGITSGPARERAAELTRMLCDPSIRCVIPPWGGDTAIDMVDLLDWDALSAAEPTWLVGYSDLSTILLPITTRLGWATLHGDNLADSPYAPPSGLLPWLEIASNPGPHRQRDSGLVTDWWFGENPQATDWKRVEPAPGPCTVPSRCTSPAALSAGASKRRPTLTGRTTLSMHCDADELPIWAGLGTRTADAFEIAPGGLVVIRDRCGRSEVVDEVVIAFERRGITAVVEPASDRVLERVFCSTDPGLLSSWAFHRSALLERADGVVSLGAGPLPELPEAGLRALREARAVMEEVESRRALPFLTVAVPTTRLAGMVGRDIGDLDQAVHAALAVSLPTIRRLIESALARASGDPLILRTRGCELLLRRGGRPWLADDGHISAADQGAGAVASTLPCGSVYTTVLEDSVNGTVRLPELAGAHDVVLTFMAGRVVKAEGPGAETVLPWLAGFDSGAASVSHIGLALNPACSGDTGWTILDEHRAGTVFLALGENRYMGGVNASTLNHDVVLPRATLSAMDPALTVDGELV